MEQGSTKESIENSLEELQKIKLIAEINNLKKSSWRTPTFWVPFVTLIIAIFTYMYLLNTGLFDFKQAHLAYVTDTLYRRAAILDRQIKNQEEDSANLHGDKQALMAENLKLTEANQLLESLKKDAESSLPEYKREIFELKTNNATQQHLLLEKTSALSNLFKNYNQLKNNYIYQDNLMSQWQAGMREFCGQFDIFKRITTENPKDPIIWGIIIGELSRIRDYAKMQVPINSPNDYVH